MLIKNSTYCNLILSVALILLNLDAIYAHQHHVNFTENKGQWPSQIIYKADLDGGALFIENNCFTYHLYDKAAVRYNHLSKNNNHKKVNRHAFKMKFINCNKSIKFKSSEKYPSYKNYFIGKNHLAWAKKVNSWEKITAENLYPGIDMETEGLENGIKYQFNIAPGAKYQMLQLNYEGADKIWLENNELHIKTSLNEMVDQRPIAWQIIDGKKIFIDCQYILKHKTVAFKLGSNYNPNHALIIDPVLVFASYSGSTADNFGLTATYDAFGNLYAGGLIYDIGYPTTLGAYDDSYNGSVQYGRTDISISKFDSTGTTLLYSTYFGGANNTEVVHSMVVNSLDQLCIYGTTSSIDFPITAGSFDNSFNGGTNFQAGSNGTFFDNGTDIFVSKFSVDGTQLLASTFIGGNQNDGINTSANLNFNYGDLFRGEINVDENDNIIVGSCTQSADFPVTSNAIQSVKDNNQDGCIFKLDSNLQTLLYSTFIGGNQDDAIYAIVSSGTDVYATGGTSSPNLPANNNSYINAFQGGNADAIILKLSTVTNSTPFISYLGTNAYDQSYFVQLDQSENVYLFGQTSSSSFPYIGGVYQNANSGQFIVKLDSMLTTAAFSTTFGNSSGSPNLSPSAFLVDNCGRIYISGWGGSLTTGIPTTNMPLTSDAFQSTTDGFNFYLAVFSNNMDNLLYATYFGGANSTEHVDGGTSRFDKKGIVYQAVCAGCGSNDDFPTTPGAWSNTNNSSNCNVGVFKFDFSLGPISGDFTASPESGCSPLNVSFTNSSPDAFLWDFGNNDTTSTEVNPSRTFIAPGVYPVTLYILPVNECVLPDTIVKNITVFPDIQAQFTNTIIPCQTTVNFSDLTINNHPTVNSWNWNFGDNTTSSLQNPTHTYLNPGTYTVQLTVTDSLGCTGTSDTLITIVNLQAQQNLISFCGNNNVEFSALPDSAGGYLWNFGNPLSPNNTSTLQQTNFLYPDTGQYSAYLVVYWGNNNECSDTSFFNVNINPPFVASISANQDSCSNLVTFIETTSIPGNPSVQWLWNFGDGQTSLLQNPQNNYNAGNYNASLIVTAADGCIDTVSIPVIIKSFDAYALNKDTLLCAIPAEILLQAEGGDFYLWQPAASFTNPSNSNQLVNITTDTSFTVSIGRINAEGDTCIQNLTSNIAVASIGLANLNVNAEKDTLFIGDSTPINVDISNGNYTFLWSPSEGINNVNTDNVLATPTATTEYTLTVTEGSNCSISDKVKIYVFKPDCTESGIFIPNTFTPNADNRNDKLFVRGNYIQQLYFAIYNRWGEKIFETTDKNLGWDGYYQGNLSDPGVFGWYLKATCKRGETVEMKGNVTLIR
ncbi:MAG: PKD domain-containing protein [Bacteroidota bacterium]